ncbi:MAG: UvrD-helicase domain-containing protein [Firmicutes bacterium]|nr:UvrD-helicase domain-containing protein [Bacillota bacterium]
MTDQSKTLTAGPTWTLEQREAIYTRGCDILVAAGAGAGKTAVLVERVIQGLLSDDVGLDIERLLVVTFTEAAAAEMRQRIREALENKLQREPTDLRLQRQLARLPLASISTIHAFCSRLLRQYFYHLGIDPGFRIMAEAEAGLLRYEIVDQVLAGQYLKGDHQVLDFLDAYGGKAGDEAVKELILRLYEFQMSLPQPQEWQKAVLAAFEPESIQAWRASPLMQEAQRQVALELKRVIALLEQALDICYLPYGPARYRERLVSEKVAVTELWQMVLERQWNEAKNWSDPFESLPRISKNMSVDEQLKKRCQRLRDTAKQRLRRLETAFLSRTEAELMAEMRQLAPITKLIFQLVNQFAEAYGQAKQSQGTLDFADLERLALRLLTVPGEEGGLAPSAVALELQDRFDEVLIDEYQDTNGVQDCILAMVAGARKEGNSLTPRFMVGDIKQSIYGFRLTDPGLFLAKYRKFSSRPGASQRRIDLATNFRCRQEIIHGVNFMFRQLMTMDIAGIAYDKQAELKYGAGYPELTPETVEVAAAAEIPEGTDNEEPRRLEFYLLESESRGPSDDRASDTLDDTGSEEDEDSVSSVGNDQGELEQLEREAWLIARRINELVDGTGAGGEQQETADKRPTIIWDKSLKTYRPIKYRDIVVLMRSVKNRANQVLEVFRQAKIPVYADLGSGYFAATEVKLMISLLQVLDNPHQDIPLVAVLRAPWLGLTDEELVLVRLAEPGAGFYEAVRVASRRSDELGQKLRRGLEYLDRWRTAARRLPLSHLIWNLYQETGFYDYAGSMPKGEQRQANLRGLHDRAREFDEFAGQGLSRFVRFLERLQEDADLGEVRPIGEGEDVVRVMSMHKSKGLEFPVVFLADLGKGFNQEDLKRDVLMHKDLGLGLNVIDGERRFRYSSWSHQVMRGRLLQDSLAEEMRILYVAMTRAREWLILVGSRRDLAGACTRWLSGGLTEGWSLSSELLISANNYLDWVGPALSRHRDGETLKVAGGMEEPPDGDSVANDPSGWHIWVEGYSTPLEWMCFPAEEQGYGRFPWKTIQKLQPINPAMLTEKARQHFARQLLWRYPTEPLVNLPAKISVTELKRWVAPDDEESANIVLSPSGTGVLAGGTRHVTRRPRFILAERDRVSAVERGIWTHTILQQLDLTKDLTKASVLENEALRLVKQGFLTEKQLDVIDLESIGRFFQGALGKRLLQRPKAVRREVPFTLATPVDEVYGQAGMDDDHVIVQGVIDCLVEEREGILLIDFKTDRVSRQSVHKVAASYRVQIDQYCRAVEMIFGQKVWQAYLYFLQKDLAVPMPDIKGQPDKTD